MSIKIILPVVPKAQQRPKFCNRGGFVKSYKANTQVAEEVAIENLLLPYRPATPLTGALFLGVKVYLPIPQSKSNKWKNNAISGIERPTTKPDLDNLIKNIKDCLTRLSFWRDDAQVVGYLETGKFYGEQPRWELEIISQEELKPSQASLI
ncbi:RusA family crossover junction endodeoxyribonuclease [Desulfovibrio litoralis]|uniref:Holliday junction resolvase RusA (Prophage-encoded endonuclease) n=1 Tax=Desulfovibrio litoralis DSM 11393 TaxID=1121455 RepID=A0A1M7T7V2_9BACT|nr:RusA family crossover junction endodeoxyribonuclease [Desulfovibrio litoralis]SHN66742.1 Holliday junction resolvase RusA (prophage-encoded endonuclease) [Desulfovibrio litoralis DSM 11393]